MPVESSQFALGIALLEIIAHPLLCYTASETVEVAIKMFY